jgi:hypothetical protein
MAQKIEIHLENGKMFTTGLKEKMSNAQIFGEILVGNHRLVELGNVCILKDKIVAVVIEEQQEQLEISTKVDCYGSVENKDTPLESMYGNQFCAATEKQKNRDLSSSTSGVMEEWRTDVTS